MLYTIYINTYAKIFSVVISGRMTKSESESYLEEFRSKVESVRPSEYALLIDSKDLLVPQELAEPMRKMQSLAENTPFMARYSFLPNSTAV